MVSLDLPTIRSAIWSGQLRDHSRPFHRLIRSKLSSPPAKGRSPISFRAIPIATERNAYIKTLDFDLILGNGERVSA